MSFYISLLMTVLVIGLFAIGWERRWKGYKLASSKTKELSSATPSTTELATQLVTQIGGQLRTQITEGLATLESKLPHYKPDPELANSLRRWAQQALASDPGVSNWLNSLSEPAYAAFAEHLAEFAAEMGFSLAELVDGRMYKLPKVAESATQIILDYCRANQRAARVQDDFDGYQAYAAYLKSPASIESQHFVQNFYVKLVEQNVLPLPTTDLLALPTQERLTQMQAAIQQASAKPAEFQAALVAVVAAQQHATADVTVAKIVQRAVNKVAKPRVEPLTEPLTAPITGHTTESPNGKIEFAAENPAGK